MFELSLTPDNTMEMIGDVIQSLTPMGHVVPLGTRGRDGTIQYQVSAGLSRATGVLCFLSQLCTDENHLFPAVLQALRAHNGILSICLWMYCLFVQIAHSQSTRLFNM